jgi:hypothetical protein
MRHMGWYVYFLLKTNLEFFIEKRTGAILNFKVDL